MEPLALFAIAALTVSVGVLGWTVLSGARGAHTRALANLRRGLHGTVSVRPEPGLGALRRLSRRIASKGAIARLDRLLSQAGRPAAWPLDRVLGIKFLGTLLAVGFGLVLVSVSRSPLTLLLAVVVPVLIFFLPELLLYNTALKRRQEIALELADTLDQMSIAVEAGLGFDAAMVRVARNGKGPLAQELIRTLQDVQVGQTRRAAYEDLADRTGVPDLRHFVRTVIQAETYGIALADVLTTQANEMRLIRRQRAEEKAMQIPVKVIFPLIICILPVLFIVLIGPAVLSIIEAFGSLS